MDPVAGLSPLVLAYVGDAVYELLVRTHLVRRGPARLEQLHREAVRFVRAASQARLVPALEAHLTAVEKDILRRGRNARPGHLPRSAVPEEYHFSTALESLFGYLYLKGEWQRLDELTRLIFELAEV
ncbi:MAG: mini-ribonuclease [Moorella sp. (in: firmicutes)]|uniref:Mini-ribonuclease 3 n=1 Tax=unclassified Neomoorella TaxID=2676739 RepID=UPI0010FFADCE|nr:MULTISPECIES: ribonuclease III domain-containing protein [unclassified Moorella (in: firmicutes)]MDK2817369.1 mini-ribonuclease [Moorella sp. (in: firmicutes)]MDK2894153.1 mini-ribonuclease [Moorella sp. (in: firmicutes)]GEA14422.1 mini-ribonuclease 3 [Moorella sp. E308F]GEA18206.1 mini-ribonuclease 3 [Moorella sp. E306M]